MKAKLVVLFDPSIAGFNKGDDVIYEAVEREINLLSSEDVYITSLSTKQGIPYVRWKRLMNADLFVIAGSNMLNMNTNPVFGSGRWTVSLFHLPVLKNVVLCGVGWQNERKNANFFGRFFYKNVLSSEMIHSVRDEFTNEKVKENGIFNVINTSCPSMWNLTQDHLEKIPSKKAENVVVTFTPKKADKEKDRCLLKELKILYKNVFFFPQALGDYEYFSSLQEDNITTIKPRLEDYDKLLEELKIDYIGTRLHGGIRAIQKGKRSFIIKVDHRAKGISNDTGLPVISRNELDNISELCKSPIEFSLNMPFDKINNWREQIRYYLYKKL